MNIKFGAVTRNVCVTPSLAVMTPFLTFDAQADVTCEEDLRVNVPIRYYSFKLATNKISLTL